ncbi:anthranilate synthase family protein [Cellulosimicrobium protaetiae]|uniref:anthranilate synthase family protein n=1 Tax=Cellulosimicrobium protaetiae TaxID=2587808 RepID=UPI001C11FA58|nr:anthranilate synthase family protein [Cellulosimicrobium protaetiae]
MTTTLAAAEPYCLLHQNGRATLLRGPLRWVSTIDAMPAPTSGHPVVSVLPFAQIRERGFAAHDDGAPILALEAREVSPFELDEISDGHVPTVLSTVFRPSDEEYADVVRRVVADEIEQGEGSNFLVSRAAEVVFDAYTHEAAAAAFARLARNEFGAYLTFCFFDGDRWILGASPERHLTHRDGTVLMNPICGTLPRSSLSSADDLLAFLRTPKEVNELFQVVDEEMKVMARICRDGGTIRGPYLKEMRELVHTEYVLEGRTTTAPVTALTESMYAATMVGSPLENAARVIERYEDEARRYYASAIVVHEVVNGVETLDSAITIRTAEIDLAGRCTVRSGASIVRDSDPDGEVAEVRAKARGMLSALTTSEPGTRYLDNFVDDEVRRTLAARNESLSTFWLDADETDHRVEAIAGRSALIVDNGDQFTEMLRHMVERLGMVASVVPARRAADVVGSVDLVILGPGPGDPNDLDGHSMRELRDLTTTLLETRRPVLAVCLGHQMLCSVLGMDVRSVSPPLQGVQKEVDLFGARERVGFYNTFFAVVPDDDRNGVEICELPGLGVLAVRGETFVGFQFHVESILTANGISLLGDAVDRLLA